MSLFIIITVFVTVNDVKEQRVLDLTNISSGQLLHVNYPLKPPPHLDFTDRLFVPVGKSIHIQFFHAVPTFCKSV